MKFQLCLLFTVALATSAYGQGLFGRSKFLLLSIASFFFSSIILLPFFIQRFHLIIPSNQFHCSK